MSIALILCTFLLAVPPRAFHAYGQEPSRDLFASLAHSTQITGLSLATAQPVEPNNGIYGWVWEDLDQNELWDEGEPRLEGWVVFLDDNQNGRLDEGEISSRSDSEGYYSLKNLAPGRHQVTVVVENGWTLTWPRRPTTAHTVEVVAGEAIKTYFGATRQPAPAAPVRESISSARSLATVEHPLLEASRLDGIGRSLTQCKERSSLPVTLGAWHWWHVNTGGPFDDGYGIPELSGTYSYYLYFDPEWETDWKVVEKTGVHIDLRFRDGGDPFRPFYSSSVAWFDTAYAWALTDYGTIKGGAIWKRFGLDWDGTWWGPVQYFDGFKLDTDWGVSWEDTPEMDQGFKVDKFIQFFIHENAINGSLVGADPESIIGSAERNTLVARLVPTWQVSSRETMALGISALVGQIENAPFLRPAEGVFTYPSNGDQVQAAWAVDLTYATKDFRLYGEAGQSYGTRSPIRYTSGGPSNRLTSVLAGFQYACGPLTTRFNYSVAFDDNPAATQHLFVPSVTLALTDNIDLQVEYVRQHVQGNAFSPVIEMEDGLQFLVHWQF